MRIKQGLQGTTFCKMQANNIGTGVHYSVYEHPYYQRTYDWKVEDYPNAMKIGRQTVSLPFSQNLMTKISNA